MMDAKTSSELLSLGKRIVSLLEQAAKASEEEDSYKKRIRRYDGGQMRIYSGPVPRDISAMISSKNNMLAELEFSIPAFTKTEYDSLLANFEENPVENVGTGTATFYRIYEFNGKNPISQGKVGKELRLTNTDFVKGGCVTTRFRLDI